MSSYISQLYDFLRRLDANNNREWFKEHKTEYDDLRAKWLVDLQRMINYMSRWEPGVARFTAAESAYRIYRDTRFSLDKTPYKVYFSAWISPYGRHAERAAYYMQLDIRPGESGLYGGLWHPEAWALKKMRHAIVDNIEEFEEALTMTDAVWCGDMLKTAPKGWPKDHPLIGYLKMKDYGKWYPTDEKFFNNHDWPEIAAEKFHSLKPFVDFINYSLEE